MSYLRALAAKFGRRSLLIAGGMVLLVALFTIIGTRSSPEVEALPSRDVPQAETTTNTKDKPLTGKTPKTRSGAPSTPWDEVVKNDEKVMDVDDSNINGQAMPEYVAREDRRVQRQRPLLQDLPMEYEGISVDIAGLADDDKTVELTVSAGDLTGKEATRVYKRLLRKYDDTGKAYYVTVVR